MLALTATVVKWDSWGKTETFHGILGLEENFVNILLHFLLCQMALWQSKFSSGCSSQRKEAHFSPNLGFLAPIGECLDVGWPQKTSIYHALWPSGSGSQRPLLSVLLSSASIAVLKPAWLRAFSLTLGSIHFLNSWLVFSLENGHHFSLNEKRCNCLALKKIPSSTNKLPPAGSSCLRLDITAGQEAQGHLVSLSDFFSFSLPWQMV